MEIKIYGFKAKVTKDVKGLVGTISELHITDQARNLKELESELKDAVNSVADFVSDDPKVASKYLSASAIKRLKMQIIKV